MLHGINAHLIKDNQPNLPFKLHKFCLLTTLYFVYPYTVHDTDAKKKGGEVHLIKQQAQVKCLPHMSLYSKDDCRKISGNQLPSKQESPVGPLPCRDHPQRALPCPVLHPCSVMFTYSGRRRGAAGPSERGDVAYHEQEKLNWALCYWATVFFLDFWEDLYTTRILLL